MIPETATEENIKPVLDLMMPSIVYSVDTACSKRRDTFVWIDKTFDTLSKELDVTPVQFGTFQAMVLAAYQKNDDAGATQ